MKLKLLLITILFCAICVILPGSHLSAQSVIMRVKLNNGSIHSFDINDIKKIRFAGSTDISNRSGIEHVMKTFTLLQNYPNPFNPTTTIEYSIPNAGAVVITIYDILGRKIQNFTREYPNSGTHEVIWNAKNNSGEIAGSGIYLYTVEFENAIIAKKMLLVK